ncbi:hypothetical protein CSV76_15390 [Sporosarcina sp. P17b]|nr:hypothetical protein CSV76_15390 [Sporosarcina sp. P17b]
MDPNKASLTEIPALAPPLNQVNQSKTTSATSLLPIIKEILNLTDDSKNLVIDHYIQSAKQRIMNECWRDDFPVELDHIVVEMVTGKMNNTSIGGITSIKRGDTSMSYDSSDAFHRTLERYSGELERFRRVIIG